MFVTLSLAAAILSSTANALAIQPRDFAGVELKYTTPKSFAQKTPDELTKKFAELQRNPVGSVHSSVVLRAAKAAGDVTAAATNGVAPLNNLNGVEYLVPIKFGSQSFSAILDTGSSDTWLISSKFQCVTSSGQSQSQKSCNFGPPFNGDFGTNKISGLTFNISYGDGEFVGGDMGYQDVTIAGITVPKQEVALGTRAFWNGDGVSSGLVGLAYPGITSAFKGTARQQYDPLFTHMYKSGLSTSSFSLALQRGNTGGYIAFGGLPPVNASSSFATTSIQTLSLGSTSGLTFYAMTPSSLVLGSSTTKNSAQYIVDSGTTLNYVPSAVASQINGQFSPKAKQQSGAWLVDCKAKAPKFGVTIGGQTFYADARDLILSDQPDPQTGLCITAFQDGGSGPYILGDAWMKSVVVVFDVGASQMRFATHTY